MQKHYREKDNRPAEVKEVYVGTTVFSRDTYEALMRLNLSEPDYEG